VSSAESTVVTLDGPAGAGKSTTAREVARRLGYRYLDSGALYRGLTYALLEADVPMEAWEELGREELDALGLEVRPGPETLELALRGRPLGDELRTPEVTRMVSRLARVPAVRGWLLETQQALGAAGRLVADGRDMGTVVFPRAGTKVFLDADPMERARRRLGDLGVSDPSPVEVAGEAENLQARDRQDRERAHAPLRAAPDAWVLDTTGLTFQEQVEKIVARVRRRADGATDPAPG
jgi:CMP/dCMP kinase